MEPVDVSPVDMTDIYPFLGVLFRPIVVCCSLIIVELLAKIFVVEKQSLTFYFSF